VFVVVLKVASGPAPKKEVAEAAVEEAPKAENVEEAASVETENKEE